MADSFFHLYYFLYPVQFLFDIDCKKNAHAQLSVASKIEHGEEKQKKRPFFCCNVFLKCFSECTFESRTTQM